MISEGYREQQKELHDRHEDYGSASVTYAPLVSSIINKLGVTELLDYGCGKCRLFQNLKVNHAMKLQAYDPAFEEYAGTPLPMQMVACIDVLEHIEPEHLETVLDDLQRCTNSVGFFSVSCHEAKKTLSDGRNAHLIVEPPEWWLPKFIERFEVQTFQRVGDEFYVIVYPKLIEVA